MNERVATTTILEDLSNDAWKRGYNRRLDWKVFEANVDPDGVHVLGAYMIHEHKAGKPCEPHARCRVFIKVKDTMDPVEAWLDVELGKFNKLPTVETYKAMLGDTS